MVTRSMATWRATPTHQPMRLTAQAQSRPPHRGIPSVSLCKSQASVQTRLDISSADVGLAWVQDVEGELPPLEQHVLDEVTGTDGDGLQKTTQRSEIHGTGKRKGERGGDESRAGKRDEAMRAALRRCCIERRPPRNIPLLQNSRGDKLEPREGNCAARSRNGTYVGHGCDGGVDQAMEKFWLSRKQSNPGKGRTRHTRRRNHVRGGRNRRGLLSQSKSRGGHARRHVVVALCTWVVKPSGTRTTDLATRWKPLID